jgi:hypothetical protein
LVVLNRDTGRQERLGSDTNELLIGVFVSKPAHDVRVERARNKTVEHLRSFGVANIAPLPDPVPPDGSTVDGAEANQLGLFGG